MSEDIERPLRQRNCFKQQWGGGRPKIARTGRSRNYEDRWETTAYQHNMSTVVTGKHAIFGLTQPLKTAS
jgi:hypothetical protein